MLPPCLWCFGKEQRAWGGNPSTVQESESTRRILLTAKVEGLVAFHKWALAIQGLISFNSCSNWMRSVIYSLIHRKKQFVELKQRACHSFM